MPNQNRLNLKVPEIMRKLTEDKVGSKIREIKFDLRNFGADKILVIQDPKKRKRRKDFISAWSHFSGFDYEFVKAVTPDDFEVDQLISNTHPEFKIHHEFYDSGDMCMTKPILAIACSHFRAYNTIFNLPKDIERVLVLEDDARPTKELMEYIYTGEYKKMLDYIGVRHFDYIFLGTADKIIKGKDYNDKFKKPKPYTGLAAHAVLYHRETINTIIDAKWDIQFAADTFLHHLHATDYFTEVYSPYLSCIQQQREQLKSQFLPKTDPDFDYSTGSQVNHLTDEVDKDFPYISKDMMKYIHKDFFKGKDDQHPIYPNLKKIKWVLSKKQDLL